MSITLVYGRKNIIKKLLNKLEKYSCAVIIPEHLIDLDEFRTKNYKIFFINHILEIINIVDKLAKINVKCIVVVLFEVLMPSDISLRRKLIEKLFIKLFALMKAKELDIFILSPQNSYSNEPLIKPPNYLIIKVQHEVN